VTLGGRWVPVKRPRVRASDGTGEVPVPAYELFKTPPSCSARWPRGIRPVQSVAQGIRCFDDPNLMGSAGPVPVMRLAERAGLQTLLGQQLSVPSPNAAVKAVGVIDGMLACATASTTWTWSGTA
jgi:hypothetical protein